MQEHLDSVRQAQLREAAEALVGWVHARRATWSDEPFETATPPPVYRVAPAVVEDRPTFGSLPLSESLGAFDVDAVFEAVYEAEAAVEPPIAEIAVAEPATSAARFRFPTDAFASVAATVRDRAVRIAPMAAVVALTIGVGWLARPYVGRVKTLMSGLTEKPISPKPDPVATKPAPVAGAKRMGQLTARSEPAGAKVLVDGKERGVTPLTLDVSLGSHTVVLRSEKGSVRRVVTVAADREAVVSESIYAGWLTVFAPFEVQITEGTLAIRLDESNKVMLTSGPHDLQLENRDLGYRETRRVEVQPGETTTLSLVASPSTLTVTASTPAVVLIDGQQVGDTPLTNHPITLGTRDIIVKAADGTERTFTRKVTVAPVQIDVDFSKP